MTTAGGPTADATSGPPAAEQETTAPGRLPATASAPDGQHLGVLMTGHDGADGPKAFYIHVEARPGREDETVEMLREILACVEQEPATGPWFCVRYAPTVFAIFEAFPDIAGRDAHVDGGGGDIFRDLARMNHLLVQPAHVAKVDVLMAKRVFA